MLSGSCYGLHCIYWEMTLSSYIEGRQVKCEWIVLLIALHVLGDDTE